MLLGVSTRDANCAICPQPVEVGQFVYFDATKSQGKHLAHRDCWETLRKSRSFEKNYSHLKDKTKRPVKSKEALDPPF